MRKLAHVHLRGEVAADRLLERLARLEVAAGQRPAAGERLARALPEQHTEEAVPDLEDGRQGGVGRNGGGRVGAGRLGREFSLHSRKH